MDWSKTLSNVFNAISPFGGVSAFAQAWGENRQIRLRGQADANMILAQQGIDAYGNQSNNIWDNVKDMKGQSSSAFSRIFGNFFGAGGAGNDNLLMPLAVAFGLIVALILLFKKKKKK